METTLDKIKIGGFFRSDGLKEYGKNGRGLIILHRVMA